MRGAVSRPWLNWTLIALGVVLLAGLVVLLLFDGDDGSPASGEPQIVSAAQLESFAADLGHPVYWLGERPDSRVELTETSAGRVYVRYLDAGAEAGDPEAKFLTVGTYPVEDGVEALERTHNFEDNRELAASGEGGVVLIDTKAPRNAHLAYPGDDFQIEIFSPIPGEAIRLASSDRVRPVP